MPNRSLSFLAHLRVFFWSPNVSDFKNTTRYNNRSLGDYDKLKSNRLGHPVRTSGKQDDIKVEVIVVRWKVALTYNFQFLKF
jgi:hypothetical protein